MRSPPSSFKIFHDADMRCLTIFFIILNLHLVPAEDSYSFHKFSGPVSGEVRQIVVPGRTPDSHVTKYDFVAKPDYSYTYGVQDAKTGNSQTHKESRDGDTVRGEYRVLQADGVVRIVKYRADPDSGFQATVEYANLNKEN